MQDNENQNIAGESIGKLAADETSDGQVRIYCENCGDHQPLEIEEMRSDALNGNKVWGDLLCGTCRLVIISLIVPKAGIYQFRLVDSERQTSDVNTQPSATALRGAPTQDVE